ncbi:MAG TPA: hypothetical protein DCE44_22875, partial [Verrucomicrobiales bacterium]|nr:hypothetical protein [Verrucomicrobiales bacterium]
PTRRSSVLFDLVAAITNRADLLSDNSIQDIPPNVSLSANRGGRLAFVDGSESLVAWDHLRPDIWVSRVNGESGNVGTLIRLPSGATLRVNSDGSFTYDTTQRITSVPSGSSETEEFTYEVAAATGVTASATARLTTYRQSGERITGLSPGYARAFSEGFSLEILGEGFDPSTAVFWNGLALPTAFLSQTRLVVPISPADLQTSAPLTTAWITIKRPSGPQSPAVGFQVAGSVVQNIQTAIVSTGQSAAVTTAPTISEAAGVTAVASNNGESQPITLSAVTYSMNPIGVTVPEVGGGYFDLAVFNADAADSTLAAFYYPSAVLGDAEAAMQLLFFNGTAWVPVRSSGNGDPVRDTADDLDSTASGGRFSVLFDQSSTPKITELVGTVFTITATSPPTIVTQPQSIAALGGESVTFSVVAEGLGPLSYQWLKAGTEIVGATAASLTLPSVSLRDAGVYSVRVSNPGRSVESADATLAVTLRASTITWPTPASIVYGTALSDAQLNATADVPGSFSYSPAIGTQLNPGNGQLLSVTFTPADLEKYLPASASVSINVARAPLTIRANNVTKTYGAAMPSLSVSYIGFVNNDTEAVLTSSPSLTTTATASSPVGSYPIAITGGAAANYIITLEPGTLTVARAPLTVTADNKSKRYAAANPSLTFTYAGFVNGDTPARLTTPVTISTTATVSSDAGTYPIRPAGATSPNYTITFVEGTLTVTRAPLVVTIQNRSKAYGQPLPSFGATYSGFVNNDTVASLDVPVTFSTPATVASAVGNYPITGGNAADRNYSISYVDGILTVTRASLTIRPQNQTKVYGSETIPPLTATYTGFVLGETPANLDTQVVLRTSVTASSPVGAYPITATGATARNYSIQMVSGTLSVTQARLDVTADDKEKRFGQPNPPLTYRITGFVLGETEAVLDRPVVISTDAAANSAPGVYRITVSNAADANYTVRFFSGQLRVRP